MSWPHKNLFMASNDCCNYAISLIFTVVFTTSVIWHLWHHQYKWYMVCMTSAMWYLWHQQYKWYMVCMTSVMWYLWHQQYKWYMVCNDISYVVFMTPAVYGMYDVNGLTVMTSFGLNIFSLIILYLINEHVHLRAASYTIIQNVARSQTLAKNQLIIM